MRAVLMIAALAGGLAGQAQDVSLEYRVKAAYLFNFTKFVEWPPDMPPAGKPLTICVAAPSPFGSTLEDTIAGEVVAGHSLAARVAMDPTGCHVLFVPGGLSAGPLLRATAGKPILTVGESEEFLSEGGIVNFFMEEGKVRFEINQSAASRAQLRISSRLLRLARIRDTR